MITNDNFFQVVYFVLSLLFEKILNSIEDWSEYVTNDMIKDETDQENKLLKRSLTSNSQSNKHSSKKQKPNNSKNCQQSKKSQRLTTITADLDISDYANKDDLWQDLIYESLSKWEVIGYGLCGVVCLATIRVLKK